MAISRRFAVLPALAFALSAAVALAAEMSRDELREMEDLLARLGFPPGEIDGTVDDKTRDAIAGYQDFAALPGDPEPSRSLLEELRGVVGQVEALRRTRDEETAEELGDFGEPTPEPGPLAEVPAAAVPAAPDEPEPALEADSAETALSEPAEAPGAVDSMPAIEEPVSAEPTPDLPAAVPEPLPVGSPPETLAAEEPPAEEPAASESEAVETAAVAPVLAETPPDQVDTAEPISAAPEPAEAAPEEPVAEEPAESVQTETALAEDAPEGVAPQAVADPEPVPEEAAPEEAVPDETAPEVPSPAVTEAEVSETEEVVPKEVVPEEAVPERAAPEEPPTEASASAQSAALPTPAPEPEPEPAPTLGPSAAALKKARITKALAPYRAELSSGELSYGDLARNFNEQGRGKFNGGRYEEALGDFDAAIYLQPNFAAAYHNRAKVHQAMGDAAKAQEDFDKAFDLGFTRLNLQ